MKVPRVIRACVDAAIRMRKGRGGSASAARNAAFPNVARLCDGTSARVVAVQGDGKAARRLAAMGVAPGAVIVKKRSEPMRGPVILEKGATRFAIGYGMALKVIVQPLDIKEKGLLP
ncbi:MAG TPA: FeoA family protein [Chitinivibrionales bacterium]|nr:FeoA family protein [Chitinivibrionales bacterium]